MLLLIITHNYVNWLERWEETYYKGNDNNSSIAVELRSIIYYDK